MDFYDVVGHVLELLQRQGRVSYRALKRQFSLDDNFLDDLKEELLYAHESSVQADDRGFAWIGETEATPVTTSQPDQPEPMVEQAQPVQDTSSPVKPYIPDAERRQLTVMFVDLIGSTRLSGELDPEDLREVVRTYQSTCTDVIQRYDGYVAQHLGDGLLVYFGYPQAHEDDPQRAVHTGLEITTSLKRLNARLAADQGIQLSIRMGIHTGLVVVGEMGSGERQEQWALGETPNIAARIQGLAEPDTLIISDATHRLIRGYFDCEALGEYELRGVAQPIVVYRVLQESGARSRLDIASARGLTPLVGREQEVGLLLERWGQAKDGQGQVVLLSGEAGIGKSRLVQVLKDHVADTLHTRLECRSSPYFTNSALYPMIEMVQRALRFQTDDTPEQKLEKLEQNLSQYRLPLEETIPLFATLLSLSVPEDRYPPLNLTPQRRRQKTFEALLAIIFELSERKPVLFILEDLHWTDPTTLELLELLIDQTPTASLYVLVTCRPEYQPTWSHRSYLTEVTVHRLSRHQIARMAEHVAGDKPLPAQVIEQLVDKTDGVPLYLEEMTKSVMESGVLKEQDDHYELTGSVALLAIPATLHASLMARLDRLTSAKSVAQLGAVIGRQFSYELLQAVSQRDEDILQKELGKLIEAELVYQRGQPPQATYMFKHALIQDAAYASLLRSTRQQLHKHVAENLETTVPNITTTNPEVVAYHYTEAGYDEQAVKYWYRAGWLASRRSAHMEAIAHLTLGLNILKKSPETDERHRQELDLQLALGHSMLEMKKLGVVEAEQAYRRSWELSQHVDAPTQQITALSGLRRAASGRGDTKVARYLSEQLLELAQQQHDTNLLVEAHYSLGVVLQHLGEIAAARNHFEQGISLDPSPISDVPPALQQVGVDPSVGNRIHAGRLLWIMGYPDQAVQRDKEALSLAKQRAHPYSQAFALMWSATLYAYRREEQLSQQRAEAAIELATIHTLESWLLHNTIRRGWALGMQGDGAMGLSLLQPVLSEAHSLRGYQAYYLCLLAEVYGQTGHPESGLQTLAKSITIMETAGDQYYKSEAYRLQGELLLRVEDRSLFTTLIPEACFHQSLNIARQRQAKSWELRAATSLAKLWQQQGKRQEAYDLLAPVYEWFTEGFDTADLIDAKALLDELSEVNHERHETVQPPALT